MRATWTDSAPEADDGGFDIGSTLGPYRLVRRIGRGGMGLVFEAVRADLGRRVAVKVLHARVDGPVARERFLREGRAASRVRHPNAVEVFDSGVEGGVAWLAMECLAGEDLAVLLHREGSLPVGRLTDLLLPVLAAVGAAHAEGIIHRDLKPENVFLTTSPDGAPRPKVLDFGVARLLDEDTSLTSASVLLGTPLYLSPEQAVNSRNASMLSDQYALGVVLYEASTGRLPFDHEGLFELLEAIVRAPVPPPRSVKADIPEAFEAVVLRALARVPAHRFPSVHALGAALLPFASPAARELWTPTFAAHNPCRTLPSIVPPVPLVHAPPEPTPPRGAVTLEAPLPALPSSRPPVSSTPTGGPQPVDVAPAATRPDHGRWTTAALVALSVAAAWVLVPHPPPVSPAAAAPPPLALARPVEAVVAPAPAPAPTAPVVTAPLATVPEVATAPEVAAPPPPRARRPLVARPASAAARRPPRRDVLILR